MPPLSSAEFRRVLGQFATGVAVVTVEQEPGQVHGMTANSFTSVSLHPFLILICVDHRARLLPLLQRKRQFGVSVLSADQEALSEYFAQSKQSHEAAQRLGVRFRWTKGGSPLLEGTLAQLGCRVTAHRVAGDHTIVLGAVENAHFEDGQPLLFWSGGYRRMAP